MSSRRWLGWLAALATALAWLARELLGGKTQEPKPVERTKEKEQEIVDERGRNDEEIRRAEDEARRLVDAAGLDDLVDRANERLRRGESDR